MSENKNIVEQVSPEKVEKKIRKHKLNGNLI